MKKNVRNDAINELVRLNYSEKTAPHIVDAVIGVFAKSTPAEVTSNILLNGYLQINTALKEVVYNKKKIHLTSNEFRFLEYFARNSGRVLSHEIILNAIWGHGGDRALLRVMISGLRKKISPDVIKTRTRDGYYMESFPYKK